MSWRTYRRPDGQGAGWGQTCDRTDLDSGVQEVDPLGNLQVAPGRVIEGVEVRIRL